MNETEIFQPKIKFPDKVSGFTKAYQVITVPQKKRRGKEMDRERERERERERVRE